MHADLERVAEAAEALAAPGEALAAVIPTEPEPGLRIYLCAFDGRSRTWAAVDGGGAVVRDRALVRSAVAIAALCELAEDSAGGGRLEDLLVQLETLRVTEHVEGIEEAETAALELQRLLGRSPRLAAPAYLDEIGAATRALEQALGEGPRSPFVEAMKGATPYVEELQHEVESGFKGELKPLV